MEEIKTEEPETEDAEGGCFGCLFFIGLGMVVCSAVWLFGAWGVLLTGLLIVCLVIAAIVLPYRRTRAAAVKPPGQGPR